MRPDFLLYDAHTESHFVYDAKHYASNTGCIGVMEVVKLARDAMVFNAVGGGLIVSKVSWIHPRAVRLLKRLGFDLVRYGKEEQFASAFEDAWGRRISTRQTSAAQQTDASLSCDGGATDWLEEMS